MSRIIGGLICQKNYLFMIKIIQYGFRNLKSDIYHNELPGVKGLSPTNLKYTKYYYELFMDEVENRPQLVDDLKRIPWGHLRFIIDSCKGNVNM